MLIMPDPVLDEGRICSQVKSTVRAILLGCAWLWCGALSTVMAQYQFDAWDTAQGLPQNTVSALIQTRDGYLWFTTLDGLVRYDGVRFTVFDKSNTKGFNTNRRLS